MRIIIAPDSFKESMTALEAAHAIEAGFKEVFPQAVYLKIPMADGGEGTVQSIIDATDGEIKKLFVTGPLGEQTEAFYGLSGDGKLAVIEMAASSGLEKVPLSKRNPLLTTTYGFGELIADALNEGVEDILLGIGGSATNDGGAGMLMALGGKLLDRDGQAIQPTGAGLKDLVDIDLIDLHPRIKDVTIRVACDVDNPLTGKNGAAYIYGPQKGANPDQVVELDQNLKNYAEVIKNKLQKDIGKIAGAGAAGGLGAGLIAFLSAKLEPGGDLLADLMNLDDKIKDADLVITGEGGINHQTIFGKTPIAVSKIAKKHEVPTIAFSGVLNKGYESIYEEGIDAVFSILPELTSLEETLEKGYINLKNIAMNVAQLLKINFL